MGLFSFIKKQFIDVIQWTESEAGVLAYRYPMEGMEIQNGAQLVVRDTQMAMFADEGKVADIFAPGTHTLNTQTLPVLTYLKNWDKFFESPFKSDVYFFSMREQLDQKWGTPEPITVRDKEFGVLRIRANGIYSYKLSNLKDFWGKISGTTPVYTTRDLEGQLRGVVMTSIASYLASSNVAFIDMAANQMEFSKKLQAAIASEFANLGLELTSFYVQSLSLPEELQRHMDNASSMRILGDLQKYAQFQTADSIKTAAGNEGGVAGAGAGLGAGLAMGQMMAQNMTGQFAQSQSQPAVRDSNEAIEMIEKLDALYKKGILTQSEFESKKAEILKNI